MSKLTLKLIFFVSVCTLLVGILFILPDFTSYPTNGFKGLLYVVGHWGLICIPVFFLLYIISVNKYIFSAIFPILFVTGSLIGFYSYFYKATLTPMTIDATIHNDLGTTLDLISPLLIITVIACLFISVLLVIYRFMKIRVVKPCLQITTPIILLILLFSINDRITNTFNQHYPFSIYHNINEYRKLNTNRNFVRINPDPHLNYKSQEGLTVVFIIGESLRSDHLHINGYERNTTPRLSDRKSIISFPRISTEYTYTNPSVAHIMTRADSVYTNLADTETSFVPLFKSSGFFTAWLANQDAAHTYISFMNECDTLIYVHPEKSVYTYSNWVDEDLYPHFDNLLTNNNKVNKLIILHTIGSHWYYNSHYTKEFEHFLPVASSKILSQNTAEEIINSYDNTVLYTDAFIDRIISTLLDRNAILIYLSDHGEALGEDNNWLHASDNIYLKNPACLIWYSDKYNEKYPQKTAALQNNKNGRYRTDFLFHSILSAGSIPSKVIVKELDIFSLK